MMRAAIVVERGRLVADPRETGQHVFHREEKAELAAACAQQVATVFSKTVAHGDNGNLLR